MAVTNPTRPGPAPKATRSPAPLPTIVVPADARPPWRVVFGALALGVLCTIIGAQAAFFAERARTEIWQAVAEVEFRDPYLLPETVATTFESPSMWQPVADREGYSDRDFAEWYSAEVAGGTQIVRISFADPDADRARRVVDGIVDAYFTRFRPEDDAEQRTAINERIAVLEALESELESILEDRTGLPRELQVDYQNELIRTRQQITTLLLRLDFRDSERERLDDTEARRVNESAYIAEEPIRPEPLKAAVFGAGAGGLVGVVAVYLAMNRTAQPAVPSGPAAGANGRLPVAARGARPTRRERSEDVVGSTAARFAKRSLDLIVGIGIMLVLSPVLIGLAVAVALTSRGPILFRQERVGKDGTIFRIHKFRSMRIDNDDSEHRAFVSSMLDGSHEPGDDGIRKLDDPRVTPVGRFIRRYSLDELPQLWDVVRGRMSLVGPRPALPWEHDLFTAEHRRRVCVRPGCSGLWQTSGRNLLSTPEMLDLDLEYIDGWSFWNDVAILLKTPFAILRGDGAR